MEPFPARPWRLDEFTWVLDRRQPGKPSSTHALAGAASRSLAVLLDWTILLAAAAAALTVTETVDPGWIARNFALLRSSPWNFAGTLLAAAGAQMGFSMLCELLTSGTTPGKALCRLRAVSADGADASIRQILIRNLLRPVDWLPFCYLAGGIAAGASDWRRRIGDAAAGTVVIFAAPLRDMLAEASTPASAYSTSEDGYLIEAYLNRESHFLPEAAEALAARLAVRLHRLYPPGDALLRDLFSQGKFQAYLRALYRQERGAASYDSVPSGLPISLPPPED